MSAKYGRIGKAKIYEFKQNRLNKYYEQKRVEVFYIIKENRIITVTVGAFPIFVTRRFSRMKREYRSQRSEVRDQRSEFFADF